MGIIDVGIIATMLTKGIDRGGGGGGGGLLVPKFWPQIDTSDIIQSHYE